MGRYYDIYDTPRGKVRFFNRMPEGEFAHQNPYWLALPVGTKHPLAINFLKECSVFVHCPSYDQNTGLLLRHEGSDEPVYFVHADTLNQAGNTYERAKQDLIQSFKAHLPFEDGVLWGIRYRYIACRNNPLALEAGQKPDIVGFVNTMLGIWLPSGEKPPDFGEMPEDRSQILYTDKDVPPKWFEVIRTPTQAAVKLVLEREASNIDLANKVDTVNELRRLRGEREIRASEVHAPTKKKR